MEHQLQRLATLTPDGIVQWLIALVVVGLIAYTFYSSKGGNFRLTDSENEVDVVGGLILGAGLGALTGILWENVNPIMIVPPFIHLRLFSFFIPVIGLLLGRGTGFIAGYIATIIWANLAGAFVALHSPLADGIFVGTTGWIPSLILRGNRTREQLLTMITGNLRSWYIRTALICGACGLFMAVFVSVSLQWTTPLSFWTGFWAIGILSDTIPMILFTGPVVYLLLVASKRYSWLPNF